MAIDGDNLSLKFLRDGYVVQRRLLSEDDCFDLFAQVLSDWRISERNLYVHKKKFRIHAASEWNQLTRSVVKKTYQKFSQLIHSIFLDDDPWLAELGSICVFPGAKKQHLHRDHADPQGKILTCFLNLTDVVEETGPLFLVPGHQLGTQSNSHPIKTGERPPGAKMTLPAGSCVLMDGSLPHCGLANTSCHSIRPVFYFSLGAAFVEGPTYGIQPFRLSAVIDDNINR